VQAYPVTWGVARNLNRVGNIYIFVKTKKDPRWQYSKLLPEGTKVNLMVARNKIASPWVIIFWFLVLSLFRGFCVVPDIYYIDMESIRTWSCMVSSFIVLLFLQWMNDNANLVLSFIVLLCYVPLLFVANYMVGHWIFNIHFVTWHRLEFTMNFISVNFFL